MHATLLAAFLIIITLNILFISSSGLFAYRHSRDKWNEISTESAYRNVEDILKHLERVNPQFTITDLENELDDEQHRIIGISTIYWYSPQKELILTWNRIEQNIQSPAKLSIARSKIFYTSDNAIRGYYQILSSDFLEYNINRSFILTMLWRSIIGVGLSILISIVISFKIARLVGQESIQASNSLQALAEGSRSVIFPPSQIKEWQKVSTSASALQEHLIYEEKQRSRWSQNIAHDLRTPVTAMKSQITACKDGVLSINEERWSSLLDHVSDIEKLIENFAYITRLESFTGKPHIDAISTEDLKKLLEEALAPAKDLYKQSITWNWNDLTIQSSFPFLYDALYQLILNAISYNSDTTPILVNFENSENNTIFKITNTGNIAAQHIPHLWDALYKVDEGRNQAGSGLGLTIVSNISRILKGSVDFTSHNGQITFILTIPNY